MGELPTACLRVFLSYLPEKGEKSMAVLLQRVWLGLLYLQ
jgi:hypothetical protein